MRKYSLRDIQLCELDMLRAFVAVCEKHGLYYVLIGGTLLGAIRHRGFIPWDDDIDIMMPRPDYEKLMKLIKNGDAELPVNMHFSSYRDGTAAFPFLKLYDVSTEAREGLDTKEYLVGDAGSKHVWIDIFPMDGAPSSEKVMQKRCKFVHMLRHALALSQARLMNGKTRSHRLLKMMFGWMFKCFSPYWISALIDQYARKLPFNGTEYVACLVWGNGERERVHRSGFMIPKKVEFEGMMVNAPSTFDEYLTSVYGNYMELPPLEKRISHDADVYGD